MSAILKRRALSVCVACLVVVAFCAGALAISTLEDTLRNPPRIFRSPSSEPPNPAVHWEFGTRGLESGNDFSEHDIGPGPEGNLAFVPAASAPWTVAISDGPNLSEDFVCAGVLVAPQWALTAAHCTYNLERRWPNDESAYVFAHTVALSSPGRRFNVREIVPYPDYDPRTLRHDLALVRFDAEGRAAGLPISLDGPPISEQVGAIGSILGWGISTEKSGRTHAERLHVIQTAILDNDICFSAANYPELRGAYVFCGRSLFKYHNICFRFGGSPMVFYDRKARLYLGGLVAWPVPVCRNGSGKPNAYLDVQPYVPWIKRAIAGESK